MALRHYPAVPAAVLAVLLDMAEGDAQRRADEMMNRRQFLKQAGAALALVVAPVKWFKDSFFATDLGRTSSRVLDNPGTSLTIEDFERARQFLIDHPFWPNEDIDE